MLYTNRTSGQHLRVNLVNVHLDWRNFGGDVACNKLIDDDQLTFIAGELDADEATQGRSVLILLQRRTSAGRVVNVLSMISTDFFQDALKQSSVIPLIVAGDFNTASHEDWGVDVSCD